MQFTQGKRGAAVLLATALLTAALTGCSGKTGQSQVSSSQETASSAVSSQGGSASSQAGTEDAEIDYSEGLTEGGYFEGVTALDYVTLPDYQNMEIPADVSTITEDELKAEMDSRLSSFATAEQIRDRVVTDGDTVNIDYVGSVDGVEFEGGNTGGNGTTVTIGVTSYIDDFLEQLIGHMPGETFDVNVTFPDPYPNNTDLSGKDAVFVTTINYIETSQTPELTDQFVKEHWQESKGWSTVEEANAGAREELRLAAVSNYRWSAVQDEAQVTEVPQSVYDYQVKIMKAHYTVMASQYGMSFAEFMEQALQVESLDALIEVNKQNLEDNARSSLIVQALCEEMGIEPAEEDIKKILEADDLSEYEKTYGMPYLRLVTRENMAKQRLEELEEK